MLSILLVLLSFIVRIYIFNFRSLWISLLLILLFLGGIIVLFTYVCTFVINFKSLEDFSLYLGLIFLLTRVVFSYYFGTLFNLRLNYNKLLISIIYLNSVRRLIGLCIIYLILVLVTSIKICQSFKGRLKSKFNF